jgi:hypothetical protein
VDLEQQQKDAEKMRHISGKAKYVHGRKNPNAGIHQQKEKEGSDSRAALSTYPICLTDFHLPLLLLLLLLACAAFVLLHVFMLKKLVHDFSALHLRNLYLNTPRVSINIQNAPLSVNRISQNPKILHGFPASDSASFWVEVSPPLLL